MAETFGARLRDRRQRQQIPLQTIAEQTKIKLSLLEALERDDVSHWPGGIFRRAFVRAYAQAIGLEPDPVVREFVELYPDPAEVVFTEQADELPQGRAARFRAALGATMRSLSRGSAEAPHVVAAERATPAPPRAAPIDAEPSPPELSVAQTIEPATTADDAGPPPAPQSVDLNDVARICTALAQVEDPDALGPLLGEAAGLLDAAGVVLWMWDCDASVLRATLAHGYSGRVLAQLPALDRNADNATAAALRLGRTCIVAGSDGANGALAVPLMMPAACGGVLAIEMCRGGERDESVRAAAAIIAAQLSAMIHVPAAADASRKLA